MPRSAPETAYKPRSSQARAIRRSRPGTSVVTFYGSPWHALHDGCACGDCRHERGMQKAPFSDWQPASSERLAKGEAKLWRELSKSLRALKGTTYGLVTGGGDPRAGIVDWTPYDEYLLQRATDKYLTETIGAPQPEYDLWRSDPSSILPANLSLQYASGITNGADLAGGAERVLANNRAFQTGKFLQTSFNRLSARGWGALTDVLYRGSANDVDKWLADKANVQPPGVEAILRHGIQNGRNSIAVGRDLSRAYDEYERWEFERLARTETAFALNAGTQAELEAHGYVRVADTPAIPIHPSCRCAWSINTETGEIVYSVSLTACVICQELIMLEREAQRRRPRNVAAPTEPERG